VLAALADEGTALLGPASLDDRQGIRACITNYRTTRTDIDLIVTRLAHIADQHGEGVCPATRTL